MAFSYNNIFPLTTNHQFKATYFSDVVSLLNDMLIDAKFDEAVYKNLLVDAQKIEKTSFKSKSSALEIELLTHAHWVDFKLKFDGEGYLFTIDWKANKENIDGYIGYQFSASVESKLHKDLLEIINNIVKNGAIENSATFDPTWERPLGRDEILEKQAQEEEKKKYEEKKRLKKIQSENTSWERPLSRDELIE